jgi:hypothetical protein
MLVAAGAAALGGGSCESAPVPLYGAPIMHPDAGGGGAGGKAGAAGQTGGASGDNDGGATDGGSHS